MMLTKNTELIIDPEDPFKNDCLDRKQSIIDLTNLVQSSNQPFVISVEAPWGWGKTSFVKLWKAYLEQEKHPCLYFNAWDNDFADDPLIAFISQMSNLLENEKDEGKNHELKTALRKAQKFGGSILRKSLPIALRIATQGLIDDRSIGLLRSSEDDLAVLLEQVAEERIKAFEQEKQSIYGFRSSLADFAKLVAKDENRKEPIVFFVDELDRCRPDYAVALLERIKHLFNVEKILFVLSIDRQQLTASVKSIYGSGMDADGYLRRFIDLSYRLPQPSTENFVSMLFKRFQIHEFFQERFSDTRYRHDVYEEQTLHQSFIELAKIFHFSLRVQEQCLSEINIVLKTTDVRRKLYTPLLSFLICLKSYKLEVFQQLCEERVNVENVVMAIKKIMVGSKFIEENLEPWITAYIFVSYCDDLKSCKILQELKDLVNNEDPDKPSIERNRAMRILAFMEDSENLGYGSKSLPYVISRISNMGHFET